MLGQKIKRKMDAERKSGIHFSCTIIMFHKQDKLIIRKVYPVVPPKVEYSLSEFGKSMIPILRAMCQWGEAHMDQLEEN